jgi:hypothetical protein
MSCCAWLGCFAALLIWPIVSVDAAPRAELGHVEGRVLIRAEGEKKPEPVKAGRALEPGDVLITGDVTRFEVRPLAGGGLWRVGRRALFSLKEGGARLLAGTALVQVPPDASWLVESRGSIVVLPTGSWLVQAVDNRGLKIVCLDGEDPVQAWGSPAVPTNAAVVTQPLRPGELVFLQPGGKEFSPIVTVYLAEVLATSRLVNGFPEALPNLRRLLNQGTAQRERLKGLGSAVVLGAKDAGGFQIAVPAPESKAVEPAH